jgi:hypothetical protein
VKRDRTLILPWLNEVMPDVAFPSDGKALSDVLDKLCGTVTNPNDLNSSVFDVWRDALSAQGIVSREMPNDVTSTVTALKNHVARMTEGGPALLAALRIEAPHVTAADIVKRKTKRNDRPSA